MTYLKSNPSPGQAVESKKKKWAGGDSVDNWCIMCQTMAFKWFTILHTVMNLNAHNYIGQVSSAPSLTTAVLVKLSLKIFLFCFSKHSFGKHFLFVVEMPRQDIDVSTVSITSISTRSYLPPLKERGNVGKYYHTGRHPNQRSRCWRFQHSQHPGTSVIGPDETFEYNLVMCKNTDLSK